MESESFRERLDKIKARLPMYELVHRYNIPISSEWMSVCPFHKDINASLKIYPDHFHCFGCGKHGDIFNFIENIEKCDFKKAVQILESEKFANYVYIPPPKSENVYKPIKSIDRVRKYVLVCQKHLDDTDYFQKRGISKETQLRCGCGYDKKYNSIVIPYNKMLTYYQARNIDTKKFYKPCTDVAGNEPLFNVNALKQPLPVFIVESPICAMSIIQFGYQAVATCGTEGWKKVAEFPMNKQCSLILCFDNDNAGRVAQRKLLGALKGDVKWRTIEYNIAMDCKDPNELLLKDADKLKARLIDAIGQCYAKIKKYPVEEKSHSVLCEDSLE